MTYKVCSSSHLSSISIAVHYFSRNQSCERSPVSFDQNLFRQDVPRKKLFVISFQINLVGLDCGLCAFRFPYNLSYSTAYDFFIPLQASLVNSSHFPTFLTYEMFFQFAFISLFIYQFTVHCSREIEQCACVNFLCPYLPSYYYRHSPKDIM